MLLPINNKNMQRQIISIIKNEVGYEKNNFAKFYDFI